MGKVHDYDLPLGQQPNIICHDLMVFGKTSTKVLREKVQR